MKQFLKIFAGILTVMSVFTACDKVDDLPHYDNGNAVVLTSSSATLTPTVADSNNVVVSFTWTNPNYATDTTNYKFVLEIDSAGRNFSQAATRTVMGKNSTSLTGRELNAILLDYGFALGSPYNIQARIASSYGNNNELFYSNVVDISVTPFNDPPSFASTASDVVLTLPTAGDPATTFTWTQAFQGYTGNITYTIEYDLDGGGFTSPSVITPDPTAAPYTMTLTGDALNQTAITAGILPGDAGTVEYRLKAVTALGAISYSAVVTIHIQSYISTLRFYMPGGYQAATGNGLDWDPPSAPQLVRDVRPGLLNNMFYIYIYLPANAEFKFTQGPAWTVNYGTGATPGTLALNGGNLTVPASGYYRISINRNTLEYNIMQGRMGAVGQLNNWTPGDVFPNYALGIPATNLFVGLVDFGATGGWKLIDNDIWNSGSNAVDETRSYGSTQPDGGTMEVNGANFADVTATGRYRAIWDGRDVDNIKYFFSPATEMRVVGDGITGVAAWDPGSSPQMTYGGSGLWTITIALEANKDIKFLAGNAWGAFDYEDNSGQSQAVGLPKKIKWEGGDNFKTPTTAGTYTITLNENAQIVTIN